MSWYSDFKSFTEKLFPLQLREEKPQIFDSKIEAKQNYCEFLCARSLRKCSKDFEKMTGF